jgi:GMP synthase (glutamine-hydrolysing)
MVEEIKAKNLNTDKFISGKVSEIITAVGDGTAINALSGGVDSSVVTMLGHRALGNRLRTVFIQNGLMREGEAEKVAGYFNKLGVTVEIIDARKEFLDALQGRNFLTLCTALPILRKNGKPSPRHFTKKSSAA